MFLIILAGRDLAVETTCGTRGSCNACCVVAANKYCPDEEYRLSGSGPLLDDEETFSCLRVLSQLSDN